jgi:hypothetical protein
MAERLIASVMLAAVQNGEAQMCVQSKILRGLNAFLLAVASFTACGPSSNSVFCETTCGAFVSAANRSPQYACSDYRKMETLLVLELSEKLPNACREFAGVTAWELPGFSTKLGTRGDGKEIWAAMDWPQRMLRRCDWLSVHPVCM